MNNTSMNLPSVNNKLLFSIPCRLILLSTHMTNFSIKVLMWSRSTPRKLAQLKMAGMNLKEKGVFVFCILHLALINHNYIASSVIPPRIFNQQELILLQSLIMGFKLFESVDFIFLCLNIFKSNLKSNCNFKAIKLTNQI